MKKYDVFLFDAGAQTQEFRALWDNAIEAANSEVKNNASTSDMAGKMIIRL